MFFRRGQELARFAVLKQPARFFPKKAFALGCAAMGGVGSFMSGCSITDEEGLHPNRNRYRDRYRNRHRLIACRASIFSNCILLYCKLSLTGATGEPKVARDLFKTS